MKNKILANDTKIGSRKQANFSARDVYQVNSSLLHHRSVFAHE